MKSTKKQVERSLDILILQESCTVMQSDKRVAREQYAIIYKKYEDILLNKYQLKYLEYIKLR